MKYINMFHYMNKIKMKIKLSKNWKIKNFQIYERNRVDLEILKCYKHQKFYSVKFNGCLIAR